MTCTTASAGAWSGDLHVTEVSTETTPDTILIWTEGGATYILG